MARPIKDGVDYFPVDVDFFEDDKVRYLRQRHKAKGMYILMYMLCEVYKNGYYLKWTGEKAELMADGMRCADTVSLARLVEDALECGFFDKRIARMHEVLTSAGIQRRFVKAAINRDTIYMASELFLLNPDDPRDVPVKALPKLAFFSIKSKETPVLSKETPVLSKETPQKEKEKETISIDILKEKNSAHTREPFFPQKSEGYDYEALLNRVNAAYQRMNKEVNNDI